MRVVLAATDAGRAEWLIGVLQGAGYSVALLSEPNPDSPELRGAELLIVDVDGAAALGDAGPERRLLVASRGSAIDLSTVEGGFLDVIALPMSAEDVVARVRHVMEA